MTKRSEELAVATGSASVEQIFADVATMTAPTTDITEDEAYEKFVESMVHHCHCAHYLRPCDGVLAGGICDNLHPEQNLFCEDEDPADRWEYDDNEL